LAGSAIPAPASQLTRAFQKYVKGKPCKPYNSALGEFFRVRLPAVSAKTSADAGSATGRSKTR
jgi:hypothetical protein